MPRFGLHFIVDRVPERPAGYYQDVISRGIIIGEEIEFTEEAYNELCAKYGSPVEYSLQEIITNFAGTVLEWKKAGCPTVSEETLKARADKCRGSVDRDPCIHWRGSHLIARCDLCKCTKLKLAMATTQCPIKNW